MIITWNDREYEFSGCSTKGKTVEEVQSIADKCGRMQYEPNRAWLVVPGIGYGWEKDYYCD